MGLAFVEAADEESVPRATELAEEFGVPVVQASSAAEVKSSRENQISARANVFESGADTSAAEIKSISRQSPATNPCVRPQIDIHAENFAKSSQLTSAAEVNNLVAANSPGTPQGKFVSAAKDLGVKVIVSEFGITLGFVDGKLGKPLVLDFLTATWRAKFEQPLAQGHIFRRALGNHGMASSLIDATAGFGQDAVLACTLGFKVTAIERSAVVSTVLSDALARAAREDERVREKLKSMRVINADAVEYLREIGPVNRPAVIYVDPMFEKPKRTAKSPKEMQLLQLLLPPDPEGEKNLLDAALGAARDRVVVKRPLKARAVKPPSHSFKGQSIRYDVYKL